jgi:hypothetical protein
LFRISLNRLRGTNILDSDVEGAEQVFLAPPFTPEVAASVSLISTRMPFRANERSRLLCQVEANAFSQREYEALAPLLGQMTKPRHVLEIGPGFGRSVVYFRKKGVWDEQAEVHLYDANGTETKYKQKHYDHPAQWPDVSSFCGNLPLLQCFLDYNHIANYRIFDAAELPLRQLPGPYELIYAFFSMGFHWSLDFYLDDLDPLMDKSSVLICTLNKRFQPFARLRDYSTRIIYCRDIKKNAAPRWLLALSKGELPKVGVSLAEAFPGASW